VHKLNKQVARSICVRDNNVQASALPLAAATTYIKIDFFQEIFPKLAKKFHIFFGIILVKVDC